MKALSHEGLCSSQEEFASTQGATGQAIFKRLHTLGMIQKQGTRDPYDLKPRDVEHSSFTCGQPQKVTTFTVTLNDSLQCKSKIQRYPQLK